ncbi:hypothetical protein CJO90_12555 [Ralstonia solanacearum]|nr:hypothetical protein CIG66_12570 [Ralstonia pseudosolanacearum]AXW11211.1 hypothetical protein CJO83_12550 [Ralstonia solanacearum]AXW43781.1 hypothetical protein CJO90_12555 [Ralstonia solanacearum]AXW67117.1 hypothetical protein CJO95_12555 [Ralstonia solanacearum]
MGQSRGALDTGGLGQVLRDLQGETVDAEARCFGGELWELGRGGLLGAYCWGLYGLVAFAGLLLLAEALFLFGIRCRSRLTRRGLSENEVGEGGQQRANDAERSRQ